MFTGTSFVGYVGILTGMKPHAFAVSVNFRSIIPVDATTKDFIQTASTSFLAAVKSAWPVAFLVRASLEEDTSYQQAVASLSTSKLISPCYITIAGTKHNEGVCITRDRGGSVKGKEYYLSQGPVVQVSSFT